MSIICPLLSLFSTFLFNATATTEIYTLSLHDALPIYRGDCGGLPVGLRTLQLSAAAVLHSRRRSRFGRRRAGNRHAALRRSEEHTSELQSHSDLVCRLLLEKKKKTKEYNNM